MIDLAVEEIVRWASPVMYFRRNVTQDTELRGMPIKAGDKVSIWYISANRDEDVFDEPFKFDVRRDPNEPTSRSDTATTSASASTSRASRSRCSSRSSRSA